MNEEQRRAARSLRNALRSIKNAGLKLRVYDGAVLVCPAEVDIWTGESPIEIMMRHGEDLTPEGLDADGGAGS